MHIRKSLQSGFTLVELSIVIIIVGLLTAGGLAVGSSMIERAAYIDTQKLIAQIQQTLRDYYIVNGRLPCVARLTDAPGTGTFGMELPNCTSNFSAPGDTQRITSTPEPVRVGMVPVRTLGLPDSAAQDKYGNRLIYAVTEPLTSVGDFGTNDGAITVQDASDNEILDNAVYFIASAGRDRKGSYGYLSGSVATACGSSDNRDVLNCTLNSAVFRDAPYNNGDIEDMFFDDITAWAPKFHFMSYDTESNALWANETGSTNIYAVGTDGNWQTGNVGIGTTTPEKALHIGNGEIRIDSNDSFFLWMQNPGAAADYQKWALLDVNNTGTLSFRSRNPDWTWKNDLLSMNHETGNVGIGLQATTGDKLTVLGSVGAGAFHVHSDATLDSLAELYGLTSGDDLIVGTINISGHTSGANNEKIFMNADFNHVTPDDGVSFVNYGLGGPNTAMHIAGNSRVGIGTDYPYSMLHVKGSIDFGSTGKLRGYPPGATDHRVMTMVLESTSAADGGGMAIIITDDNNDEKAIEVWNTALSDIVFTVQANGRIVSPATYALTTGNGPNMYVHSNGLFYRSTSSARYKKNIQDYGSGLDTLMQLRPVSFEQKDKDDGTRYAGFIAEEVDALGLKEFVNYDDNGRPDALQYGHMTALLTKAVQEMKAENDALREEVAGLKAQVERGAPQATVAQGVVGMRVLWLLLLAMLTGGVLAHLFLRRRA